MSIPDRNKIVSQLIFLFSIVSCEAQLNVYDSFEAPELSNVWATDRMAKNSCKIQSVIAREGKSAAAITLNHGDVFEAGNGTSLNTERDELREANHLMSLEDKSYEYSFSLFLPADFPIVSTRLVIAQWKQKCPGESSCSDDSPVLAIRYESGKLSINIKTDAGKQTLYQTPSEIKNKWLDFKFRVSFAESENGFVNAWLNESQIINFKGTTCYSSIKGYPGKSNFYFKTGLYRDVMLEPMTIYIDEYRKKEIAK